MKKVMTSFRLPVEIVEKLEQIKRIEKKDKTEILIELIEKRKIKCLKSRK